MESSGSRSRPEPLMVEVPFDTMWSAAAERPRERPVPTPVELKLFLRLLARYEPELVEAVADWVGLSGDVCVFAIGGLAAGPGVKPTAVGEVHQLQVAADGKDTGSWSTAPTMPTPRWEAGAAVFGDHLYVAGGVGDSEVQLSTVERFNGWVWQSCEPLPIEISAPGCCTHGLHLYVVGGWDSDETATANVLRFDGVRWAPVASLGTPRAGAGVVSHAGALWAIGGAGPDGEPLRSCEYFTGEQWCPGPDIPTTLRTDGLYTPFCFALPAAIVVLDRDRGQGVFFNSTDRQWHPAPAIRHSTADGGAATAAYWTGASCTAWTGAVYPPRPTVSTGCQLLICGGVGPVGGREPLRRASWYAGLGTAGRAAPKLPRWHSDSVLASLFVRTAMTGNVSRSRHSSRLINSAPKAGERGD